jgi:hypothetical protein
VLLELHWLLDAESEARRQIAIAVGALLDDLAGGEALNSNLSSTNDGAAWARAWRRSKQSVWPRLYQYTL